METICELEDTISALKEDLAKAKSSNLDNTTMVQKSIQSMQKHVDDTTTKATSQVKILEATVTTLESSLEKSRNQSVQLEEHVKVLEENLRLRAERDKEIEERLNRIQRTCLCFEFSS
jgi:predicted RNase H-like nuclease (RuvC/YqgF family)